MSAQRASRPAFCPFVYHDGESLYLEFDGQALRFAYTEGGLHRALKHIPNVKRQPGFLSGRSNIANKLITIARGTKHKRKVAKIDKTTLDDVKAFLTKREGNG